MNASPTRLVKIPLACVFTSPFNAERSKRYSKIALQDLADNLVEHGQIEPAIVRRKPGTSEEEGAYELVVGERRWHACAMAGIKEIDAIVRELSDRQVCGIMLSENLQRENLKPVEEACVFADMLRARDGEGRKIYETIDDLEKATGKRARSIGHRIKLLNCPDFLLEAIDAGLVPARSGEMIGRVVNQKRREEAARRAMRSQLREGPMSVAEVTDMLEREFMASLKGCGFALDDAELDEQAGACTTCPFRSGNDEDAREFMSEGSAGGGRSRGFDANLCQNPDCLAKKQAAAWKKVVAAAEAAGHRVMPAPKAKLMLAGWNEDLGVFVVEGDKYVARDGKPGHEHTGHFGNDDLPTWEELLKDAKPSWIVVRDGRRPRYFLESHLAVECVNATRANAGMSPMFKKLVSKAPVKSKRSNIPDQVDDEEEDDGGPSSVMFAGAGECGSNLSEEDEAQLEVVLRRIHQVLPGYLESGEGWEKAWQLFAEHMLQIVAGEEGIAKLAAYFGTADDFDDVMKVFTDAASKDREAFVMMIVVRSTAARFGLKSTTLGEWCDLLEVKTEDTDSDRS